MTGFLKTLSIICINPLCTWKSLRGLKITPRVEKIEKSEKGRLERKKDCHAFLLIVHSGEKKSA